MPNNQERAERGEELTLGYEDTSYDSRQDVLCDILTDLRHYAAREGLEFKSAHDMSEIHFESEKDEAKS